MKERKTFRQWVDGKGHDLDKAGDGYERLTDLSKSCINHAVNRYVNECVFKTKIINESAFDFTISELSEILPDLITEDRQYELVIIKESPNDWLTRYVAGNDMLNCKHHVVACDEHHIYDDKTGDIKYADGTTQE